MVGSGLILLTFSTCMELCAQVPSCDAATWSKNSKCWVKRSFGDRMWNVEYVVFEQGPAGSDWKKIYGHDINGGLFSNLEDAKKKNVFDENAELFSILYDLESMRGTDGMFHFKLCYPERTEHEFPCNEWKQRSNPVLESKIKDYVAIRLTWPLRSGGKPFQGLVKSNPRQNLMDDEPSGYWWNSVGTLRAHRGSIPGPVGEGPEYINVKKKVMYVVRPKQDWKKIYGHDMNGGFFSNLEEAKEKNVLNENAELFSILGGLESMRGSDGMFHFKLCYPERTEHEFPCNEWKQSSNPVLESKIKDYVAIHLTWPLRSGGQTFQGLVKSNPGQNLMDDGSGGWWNSVGTLRAHRGSIPGPVGEGPEYISVKRKVLYVYWTGHGKKLIK